MRLSEPIPTDKDLQLFEETLKYQTFAEAAAMLERSCGNLTYHFRKTAKYLMERSKFPQHEIVSSCRFTKSIMQRKALFANLLKDYKNFLSDPARNVHDPLIISLTRSEFIALVRDSVWAAMVEFEPKIKQRIAKDRKLKYQRKTLSPEFK